MLLFLSKSKYKELERMKANPLVFKSSFRLSFLPPAVSREGYIRIYLTGLSMIRSFASGFYSCSKVLFLKIFFWRWTEFCNPEGGYILQDEVDVPVVKYFFCYRCSFANLFYQQFLLRIC